MYLSKKTPLNILQTNKCSNKIFQNMYTVRAILTTSYASGQSSALGPISTQPLTAIKLQMLIKLNWYLLYWYFQQNQCSNIKKYVVHNIHSLEWGPYTRGDPGATAQHAQDGTVFSQNCILRALIGTSQYFGPQSDSLKHIFIKCLVTLWSTKWQC